MSTQPANSSAGTAGAHRVKLIKNPDFVHNGKMAYGHALRKFGFKPTLEYPFQVLDEAVKAHKHDETAAPRRLMATDEHGQVGQVNAQDVQQVWSNQLPKSTLLSGKATQHNVFDYNKSQTFKASEGQRWQITYGDGSSASGNVGTDVIDIGGIKVQNQAIEMAKKMSPSFASSAGDGLCGLAFGKINTVMPSPVRTPVENMILQGTIKQSDELFTAYLGSYKDVNDPDKGQSFYTFGFIDQDTVKATNSEIWYTPVNDANGFWQVNSNFFSINGHRHHTSVTSAIIDTGTTLALVDDHVCKSIYAAIPGAKFSKADGGFVFPTKTPQSALPDIKFDIGGKMFSVQKEDLAYHDFGNGMSYGGIQSAGNLPFAIYGDTWLKSVYAIFDVGRKRFGCVERVEPSNSSSNAKSEPEQKMAKHDPVPPAHPAQPAAPQPAVMATAPGAPPSAPNAAAPAPVPATVVPVAPQAPSPAGAGAAPPPAK